MLARTRDDTLMERTGGHELQKDIDPLGDFHDSRHLPSQEGTS